MRVSVFLTLCLSAIRVPAQSVGHDIAARARHLHFSSLVIDSHSDTTQRFLKNGFDLGARHVDGNIDIPRMREGGLGAEFFSIWIPATILGAPAVQKALDQIDLIREQVHANRQRVMIATNAAEVRSAHARGKIAILLGMEGGHMIGNDLRMIRIFGTLGVRYITLAHFYNDEWADSSTDKPVHNGLTAFGKEVVREMNRQGILVDVSHVSDKTFYDALEVSRAPLIASHSSCRAISDHPRNMSDDMIKALAAKGGVIMINYNRIYLNQAYKNSFNAVVGNNTRLEETFESECGDDAFCQQMLQNRLVDTLTKEGKLPHVGWEEIIEHIDHVSRLVGSNHVGLGSDFDGATMPEGLEDVSQLPKLTEALLRSGYSTTDIRNILGNNILRVMEEAQRVGHELQAQARLKDGR
jgi:membrane dipeptidase